MRWLQTIAPIGAALLSGELTFMGVRRFNAILAGEQSVGTFPNLWFQLSIGLVYLGLSLIYIAWLIRVLVHPSDSNTRFAGVLGHAAPFLVAAFISFPLGSDIYLYMHTGLMTLSGINPYLVPLGEFTSIFAPLIDWPDGTSPYGPVSQLAFALSAPLVTVHPIVAIYAFKAMCLGVHILNACLIGSLLP